MIFVEKQMFTSIIALGDFRNTVGLFLKKQTTKKGSIMFTKKTIKFATNKSYRIVITSDSCKNRLYFCKKAEAKCLDVNGCKVKFTITTEDIKTGEKAELIKEATAIIGLEEHSLGDIEVANIPYNNLNLVVYATSLV